MEDLLDILALAQYQEMFLLVEYIVGVKVGTDHTVFYYGNDRHVVLGAEIQLPQALTQPAGKRHELINGIIGVEADAVENVV